MEERRLTDMHSLTTGQPGQATTIVQVGSVASGGPGVALIGDPCTVEDREHVKRAARAVGREL